jgi:hypothetical protein
MGQILSAHRKDHFDDLAKALECVKTSKMRKDAAQAFTGVTKARNIGILIWLTLNKNSYTDLVSRVARCRDVTDASFETIHIVDNAQAEFLIDAHEYAHRTRGNARVTFCYPDSGQNISPLRRATEGDVLPVEYLTSTVLPFRVVASDEGRKLVLATKETFSRESIQRLLDLAHRLTQNWAHDVVIAFPDYVAHMHRNDLQAAKASFADESFTARVTADSLSLNVRNLANE